MEDLDLLLLLERELELRVRAQGLGLCFSFECCRLSLEAEVDGLIAELTTRSPGTELTARNPVDN